MGGATRLLLLLAAPFPPRAPSLLRLTRHHHYHRRCVSQIFPSSRRGIFGSSSRIVSFRLKPSSSSRQLHGHAGALRDDHFSDSGALGAHYPWPEWLHLLNNLSVAGYFKEGTAAEVGREDEFVADIDLPEEFLSAARACLAFAIDRPQLLIVLPRHDVEIVVSNGLPFLFKNADDSIRRLRSFVAGHEAAFDQAQTIDLMRFILSYASNPTTKNASSLNNQELVALSIRNLISALVKLSSPASAPNYTNLVQDQTVGGYGQTPRSRGRNIEMKRGDWICPRCNFMNFARNMKCLECEEARPKRQLTGGEWDCPQCNYLNNGRNKACLRCDCRHPAGGISPIGSGNSYGNHADKADIERRLADNEEKAQRWFSKVSQLDSTSDLSSAIADEDFPEIMPLRKGVNRFVVSTRKTPLERRLANAQHHRDSGADGTLVTGDVDKTAESVISRKLDDIMGRKSDDKPTAPAAPYNTVRTDTQPHYNASSRQQGYARGNNSSYVPFVPLPADMFAKKPGSSAAGAGKATEDSGSSLESSEGRVSANVDTPSSVSVEKEGEDGDKSGGGWFKRISDLHDEQDLTTANSDEDFPEIMPIRKGENRFVVSKNSNRSMTSPMYKRRDAMEKANNSNSNYVPFVPFPPDYFAKKENQQSDVGNSTEKLVREYPSPSTKPPEQNLQNPQISSGNWNIKSSLESAPGHEAVMGHPREEEAINVNNRVDSVVSSNQQSRSYSWSGKSLEGSQVKEPDPLDMSEEAKAERWFRRVAQIKDISELSQIPDEDFPSIMPMRKGVNRFVVSKRKTPLERRLTSSQYRRNLPVMTSDPIKDIKKDNDNDNN